MSSLRIGKALLKHTLAYVKNITASEKSTNNEKPLSYGKHPGARSRGYFPHLSAVSPGMRRDNCTGEQLFHPHFTLPEKKRQASLALATKKSQQIGVVAWNVREDFPPGGYGGETMPHE